MYFVCRYRIKFRCLSLKSHLLKLGFTVLKISDNIHTSYYDSIANLIKYYDNYYHTKQHWQYEREIHFKDNLVIMFNYLVTKPENKVIIYKDNHFWNASYLNFAFNQHGFDIIIKKYDNNHIGFIPQYSNNQTISGNKCYCLNTSDVINNKYMMFVFALGENTCIYVDTNLI